MKKQLWMAALCGIPALLGAQMQGPLNASATANTVCPYAFTSTLHLAPSASASGSDDVYASASHCDCCDANSSCLEMSQYGFSVPASAVITGIEVRIERHSSGGQVQDNGLFLLKNGMMVGSNYASSAAWPGTDAIASYGGSSDLWGTTWTPAEVNDSTFGVMLAVISYTCNGNGGAMISYVDNIDVTVYYNMSMGLNENAENNFEIFPQPVSGGRIQIKDNGTASSLQVQLIDLTGKVLKDETLYRSSSNSFELSLPFSSGVYLLEIKNGNSFSRRKIMVL